MKALWALLAACALVAGCGSAASERSGLRRLQAAARQLKTTTSLSSALASDTANIQAGMAKARTSAIRRWARRLESDARALVRADRRAHGLLLRARTALTGVAREYTDDLLAALRSQAAEARAMVVVGVRVEADPLLERSGDLRVLAMERRARRAARTTATYLARAARVRSAHPKAFTFVRETGG